MVIRWLILALLAASALTDVAGRVSRAVSPDFYQLWAVSAAERQSDRALGSPYRHEREYWAVLSRQAEAASDARLKAAHKLWPGLSPVASPLLFLLFAVLPADYSAAALFYATLQALAFLVAVLLLGRLFRLDGFSVPCLALILLRFYEPLASDMRLGNIGTFQLLALTALLAAAGRLRGARARRNTLLGAVCLIGLVIVAFVKLNLAFVVLVMALQLLITSARKTAAVAAACAVATGAVLIGAPCVYFRGCDAWTDWLTLVVAPGREIAGRTLEQGNYSTPRIIADLAGVSTTGPIVAVAVLLAGSLALAVRGRWRQRSTRIATDVGLGASMAIVATMALSPLLWLHYYVWSLIPGLWAVHAGKNDARVAGLGASSIVLGSGAVNIVLVLAGLVAAIPVVMAASWIPLWAAVLLWLVRSPAGDADRSDAPDPRSAAARDKERARGQRARRSISEASAGGKS